MTTSVAAATVALVQALVAPGYGLRILAPAPAGLPAGFYGAPEEQAEGYCYSAWYTDCGDQVMVVVEGLGTFTAAYLPDVVPTLPA